MWRIWYKSPFEWVVTIETIMYQKECININVWFVLQPALRSELLLHNIKSTPSVQWDLRIQQHCCVICGIILILDDIGYLGDRGSIACCPSLTLQSQQDTSGTEHNWRSCWTGRHNYHCNVSLVMLIWGLQTVVQDLTEENKWLAAFNVVLIKIPR